MASINKSADSKDRATGGGKGDLARGSHEAFRGGRLWWRSACCSAPVVNTADLGPDREGIVCQECECFCQLEN